MSETALALDLEAARFGPARPHPAPAVPALRGRTARAKGTPRRSAHRAGGARAKRPPSPPAAACCGACGRAELLLDYVETGAGLLGLGECGHCDHRFTWQAR